MNSRAGKSFFMFVAAAVVIAVGLVLAWGWIANKGKFDPTDPAWRQQAIDKAEPVVSQAGDALVAAGAQAKKLAQEAWGEDGVLDKAGEWLKRWREKDTSSPKPETDQAPPPTDTATEPSPNPTPRPNQSTKSTETLRLERDFQETVKVFEAGIVLYKKVDPSNGGWNAQKNADIKKAASHFMSTRKALEIFIPAYEKAPDRDAGLLVHARELERTNRQLLYNSNKMTGIY